MTTIADRNNNPGNLIPPNGRIIWQGQTGVDSRGFAIFSSREAGIRAADLNLQTYAKHGYDTVHEIIYGNNGSNGWSATDQAAYQDYVANKLGVDPNAHLDLSNPTVRQNVLAQIFNFESGTNRYSQGTLQDSWAAIQSAVESGDPIEVGSTILGSVGQAATNVVTGAVDAVNGAVGGAAEGVGNWIENNLWEGAKDFVIPVAIGFGAILLILVSSWGLVKDNPVAQGVKRAAKGAAMVAAVA